MNRCAGRSGTAADLDSEFRCGKHTPHCGDGARAASGRSGDAGIGDGAVAAGGPVGEAGQRGGHLGEQPLRQIALNCGKDDAATIVARVQEGKEAAGYDAVADVIVDDMLKLGIIDPVKVTRGAVENAVSAAAILLTTEAAIAEIPEPKKEAPDMGEGMGF